MIVPGAGLRFTIMVYPHVWKWVTPTFKTVRLIHCRTELIRTLLLKTFKN